MSALPTIAWPLRGTADVPAAALTAAAFSLSAGFVHLSYAPDHLAEWWGYGAFFLGTGMLQALLSGLLLTRRPGPGVALGAIAGNLAIIVVYVISRTPYGAPVGPMRGHAELAGMVDMATTIGELITVIALLAFLPRRTMRWVTTTLLLAGVALWMLRLTDQLAY